MNGNKCIHFTPQVGNLWFPYKAWQYCVCFGLQLVLQLMILPNYQMLTLKYPMHCSLSSACSSLILHMVSWSIIYVFTNIFCCHICIVLRLGLSLHSFIAVFRYFRPWRCSSFRWVLYIVLHLQGFHHQRGCFRVKGERYSGEKKICLPEMSTASVFADDFNHPGGRTETAPLCGRVDSNSDCNGAQLVDSVFEAAH